MLKKLMFWKRKYNPAESAARHLANLLGTSVSGFVPDPPYDHVDLDIELSRRNVSIASLVVISGLVNGNEELQKKVGNTIRPDHFREKSFEKYLFAIISNQLSDTGRVSIQEIERLIPDFRPSVNGELSDKRSLL